MHRVPAVALAKSADPSSTVRWSGLRDRCWSRHHYNSSILEAPLDCNDPLNIQSPAYLASRPRLRLWTSVVTKRHCDRAIREFRRRTLFAGWVVELSGPNKASQTRSDEP